MLIYRRLCLSLFLIVITSFNVHAQLLTGTVVDENGHPLASVIIQNHTSGNNTISGDKGRFSIAIQAGDSLSFDLLGYSTVSIVIRKGQNHSRRIFMSAKPFSLPAFSVRPDWTPYQLDSLRRRSIYHLELDREKVTSIMSPVTAIAENISKRSRQRWRFQKNYIKWEQQKYIDTRYTPEEVTQLTGLTGDSLAAFMAAYPMSADYARAATDLEIKMWIKFNYRQWKKNPKVPDLPELHFYENDTTDIPEK